MDRLPRISASKRGSRGWPGQRVDSRRRRHQCFDKRVSASSSQRVRVKGLRGQCFGQCIKQRVPTRDWRRQLLVQGWPLRVAQDLFQIKPPLLVRDPMDGNFAHAELHSSTPLPMCGPEIPGGLAGFTHIDGGATPSSIKGNHDVRKSTSPPSSPDSASASRRSTREFGSSASSTMIWDIPIWSREPCNPSTAPFWAEVVTHVLSTFCYPCLRAGHWGGWRSRQNQHLGLNQWVALAHRRKGNLCVGFQIPAHRDEAADTGAGVGKPTQGPTKNHASKKPRRASV